MPQLFTTTPANQGQKTVLLVGWQTKAVFVDPDHESLGERVENLLNADEAQRAKAMAPVSDELAWGG